MSNSKKLCLQAEKSCFFCGKTEGLVRHHVFFGSANRKKSEEYGCVVWLCGPHHSLSSNGVHLNHELDMKLKVFTQRKFEDLYGHEKFMEVFRKNYGGDESC